ncbi:hypothetical protein CgunFtcFv8_008569 [Champsocephalus gunnari]|uniref:Uncharacterized protein n=1 Tax=Champsocephalus gunnari TaxID=52237 RepID=A0AAN8HFS8_CHAGU|nr:hypothetical protein CgunFtcFv8_008569 [Champsocephalus gunnari]
MPITGLHHTSTKEPKGRQCAGLWRGPRVLKACCNAISLSVRTSRWVHPPQAPDTKKLSTQGSSSHYAHLKPGCRANQWPVHEDAITTLCGALEDICGATVAHVHLWSCEVHRDASTMSAGCVARGD